MAQIHWQNLVIPPRKELRQPSSAGLATFDQLEFHGTLNVIDQQRFLQLLAQIVEVGQMQTDSDQIGRNDFSSTH